MKKSKKIIVILGIIILPLIYSFCYLKAFWNPYNNLNKVPVALVNLDSCTENCKSDDLIKTLKDKKVLDFKVVSKEKAEKGLINKDYYAVITIPENFTSSFENAKSKDREQTTITYRANKKTNYLAYQIIGNAVTQVEETLNSKADKEIVKELTDNLQSVPEQTKEISNGMSKLSDGTKQLSNGASTLYGGLSNLNTGYKAFDNGVTKLNNGVNTLYDSYNQFNNAITQLNNGVKSLSGIASKADELVKGVNSLTENSKKLSENIKNYNTSSNKAYTDAQSAYKLIIAYANANPDALNDTNFKNAYSLAQGYITTNGLETLKQSSQAISDNSNKFTDNLKYLNTQIGSLNTVSSGFESLNSNLTLLSENSTKILSGIDTIKQGMNELQTNSKTISNGISKTTSGASTLNNGLSTLDSSVNSSINTLNSKINDTEKQVSELTGLDDYAKSPVKTKEEAYGNYDEYGVFFSPYFMSLSLWVGGLLILMGLYYDPDQRFKVLGRKSEKKGLRLVFYNIIGIIQAILLGFILKVCLGFDVTNNLLYYGSCILISLTFLSIIMFLFFNFKDVGKFLALVLLVVQLATCGGTFPIETVPDAFKAVYPFIPMTYSVDLLRESFVSINSEFIVKDLTILITYFVVFTGLLVLTGYLKRKKEKKLES